MNKVTDYSGLSPDLILDAIDDLGYYTDGRNLALNSYENRVYQIGIEEQTPIIAKFYRPERWSDAQILEEHQFSFELEAAELPVVCPLQINDHSLFTYKGYRFALYPRIGGREPNLDDPDHLLQIGRCLGRMHAIGQHTAFAHRPTLDSQQFGHDSFHYILDHFIPMELKTSYSTLCTDLLKAIDAKLAEYPNIKWIRTHTDCHPSNILWRDNSPYFVDFDDCRSAPAVQDIWLLLNGERHDQELQLCEIIEGYREFCDFDARELNIIEALRSLRIMHYAAWLARRWVDPAFPRAFPWFNTQRYWGEHILELREQLAAMQEPTLRLL